MSSAVPGRPDSRDNRTEEQQPRKRTKTESSPGLVQRVVAWVQAWCGFNQPVDSDSPNPSVNSTPRNIKSNSHENSGTEDQAVPNLLSRIIAPLQSALPTSPAVTITSRTGFTPVVTPEPWASTLRQRIVNAVTQRTTVIKPVTPALERLLAREARIDEAVSQLQQQTTRNNFPNLPLGAEEKILQALASHAVVEAFNIPIRGSDLQTLQDGRWLNDEIVNFYLNLLVQRSQTSPAYPTLHTFNTFFYSTLQEYGYAKVRRWSRKTDIFAKDLVLIPVHLPGHWTCVVVDMHSKRINYYDSMLGSNRKGFDVIRSYLAQEYTAKKGGEFDFTGWQDCAPKDIPQQRNGYDCGVFSCTFAEYASRREPFDFTQDHMPYIRRRMMYEIITKSLLTKIDQ
ncbi:hypothetical protein IWQ62_001811 [Dispira parvispora]|uniref:Ubiquitin-like protease family profile domain-containing protein n=1 Tax=Dispira parvispora TaxID=1520584 RepID=A0A9W8ASQ6_9FUNG|nr:hypothetical protein IWQ62_001811 [Dispira parvispora]